MWSTHAEGVRCSGGGSYPGGSFWIAPNSRTEAAHLIHLPHDWKPRPYQKPLWRYLSAGGKRAVSRWHRRSGKDDVSLHHTACAAHERKGNYWYLLPEYAQARKSMWDAINPHTGKRRIDEAFPEEVRAGVREDEMKITFNYGSTFQLVGSDNFDSLVGSPPVGLVFSEFALSNPASWGYLEPILMENGGWALFNSTPRGNNHYKAMCELAEKRMRLRPDGSVDPDGWYYDAINADQSGVFTQAQLQEILAGLQALHGDDYGRALWLQEYYVSFDAAIPGAIFGGQIEKLRLQGQIAEGAGAPALDPAYPVNTCWDLGRTDDTAVWFFQVFADEVRWLTFHKSNGKDIPYYVDLLVAVKRARGFQYGVHYLPHDARPRTLAAGGKSILQQFDDANAKLNHELGRFQIAPRLDKQEQVQAARATLKASWIDDSDTRQQGNGVPAGGCGDGVEALVNYRREWDEEKRVFSTTAVHDWASHPADAFMTGAVAWKRGLVPKIDTASGFPPSPAALLNGSIRAQTFGEMKKAHLKKARAKREAMKI